MLLRGYVRLWLFVRVCRLRIGLASHHRNCLPVTTAYYYYASNFFFKCYRSGWFWLCSLNLASPSLIPQYFAMYFCIFFGLFLLQAVLLSLCFPRAKCDIFRECVFFYLHSTTDMTDIIFILFSFKTSYLYFGKAIRLCRDVLMFHVSMSDFMSLVIDV